MYRIVSKPSFGMHYLTKLQNTEGVRYIKYQVPEGTPDGSVNKDNVYCCNIAEIELYGNLSVPEIVEGDINGDGVVNTADCGSVVNNLLVKETLISMESSDINRDQIINIIDLILLRSEIAS